MTTSPSTPWRKPSGDPPRLRRSAARLDLVSIVLAILSVGAALAIIYVLQSCLAILASFVLGLPLLLLARFASWQANQARNSAMHIEARSDERPPILVLRSFYEGGLAYEPATYGDTTIHPGSSYLNSLAFPVQRVGQPLAIGAPRSVDESFKNQELLYFQSDESCWKQMVELAMRAARAIILIPGVSPGLCLETEILKSTGSLSKTILFMPPTPTNIPFLLHYSDREQIAATWVRARTEWQRLGLELPRYRESGMLFVLDATGTVRSTCDLAGSPRNVDFAPVQEMMAAATGSRAPLSEIVDQLELLEVPPRRPSCLRQVIEAVLLGR